MSAHSVAIIGDGKMGQSIRDLAFARGWRVAAFIGERESANGSGLTRTTLGARQYQGGLASWRAGGRWHHRLVR
jgi:prephenate dehydrogenase